MTRKYLLAGAAALLISTPAFADNHSEGEVTETVMSSAGELIVEEVITLNFPWGMDYLPDGRLLITEKPGDLHILDGKDLSPPIQGVPNVAYKNQGGLLDVAVHPDFATNQMVYLFYVEQADDQPDDAEVDADPRLGQYVDETDTVLKGGVVMRARLDENSLEDMEVLWRQTPYVIGLGHFGGRLAFAPDGKLIITSGERQKFTPAQSEDSNLGKIIRLNDDGTIPEDNPYADQPAPMNAVWSMGHRNPLGLDFEPSTNRLFVQEMGPKFGDELNIVEAGNNYGWPEVGNGEHYNFVEIPHHETETELYTRPFFYWRPAISPSGLTFYDGEMFSDWQGDVFLGGLSSKALVRVDIEDGEGVTDERIALNRRIRDVMQGNDGSIMVLTDEEEGALLKITPKT